MGDLKRWRGLNALINDAIQHGSSAIERVHLATVRRPFSIIEQIPAVAEPTRSIHFIHDAIVGRVYEQIRFVNRLVGKTIDVTLEALDDEPSPEPPPAAVGGK